MFHFRFLCYLCLCSIALAGCALQEALPADETKESIDVPEDVDLLLEWKREGGIGGFCDRLLVTITGKAIAYNCQREELAELGQVQVAGEQFEWLLERQSQLQPFEYELSDPALADAMTIHLDFFGDGETIASEQERQQLIDFAGKLFSQVRQK